LASNGRKVQQSGIIIEIPYFSVRGKLFLIIKWLSKERKKRKERKEERKTPGEKEILKMVLLIGPIKLNYTFKYALERI